MYRMRILPAVKLLQLTTNVNNNLCHGKSNFMEIMTSALVVYSNKNFYSSKPLPKSKPKLIPKNPMFFERFIKRSNFFHPHKSRLQVLGYTLYERLVDTLDYIPFYKELNMSDTFYSWFIVTELHVWLLMVRCMVEGADGKIVRNSVVNALWQDCKERGKKLSTKEHRVNPKAVTEQLAEFSLQFNACVIAYDEGLTGDDKVLADALWRRFFRSSGNDPEKVEILVHYVRKQNHLLEELDFDEIFHTGKIEWKGLNLIKSD